MFTYIFCLGIATVFTGVTVYTGTNIVRPRDWIGSAIVHIVTKSFLLAIQHRCIAPMDASPQGHQTRHLAGICGGGVRQDQNND